MLKNSNQPLFAPSNTSLTRDDTYQANPLGLQYQGVCCDDASAPCSSCPYSVEAAAGGAFGVECHLAVVRSPHHVDPPCDLCEARGSCCVHFVCFASSPVYFSILCRNCCSSSCQQLSVSDHVSRAGIGLTTPETSQPSYTLSHKPVDCLYILLLARKLVDTRNFPS